MVSKEQLEGTPMYEALADLARKMDSKNMPPVDLNVIGGFALMLQGVRPADGVTDIDYVGDDLPEILNSLIEETGREHHMEPGWINKDGMSQGITMEDFELSTGELHFTHAVSIGRISVNVLDKKDLLRMKIISVDTAMTELEATGEFARVKDFHDIHSLMGDLGMDADGAIREYRDYMICYPETGDLIKAIHKEGPDGGIDYINARKQGFEELENDGQHSVLDDVKDFDQLIKGLDNLISGLKLGQ